MLEKIDLVKYVELICYIIKFLLGLLKLALSFFWPSKGFGGTAFEIRSGCAAPEMYKFAVALQIKLMYNFDSQIKI